jgi:hypothetical protein
VLARIIRDWNVQIRRRSARRRRTHLHRWRHTATQPPSWDERNVIIASLIPPASRVIDIGAGFQSLRFLLQDCLYQPCDVVVSTSDTWYIDFNRGIYPSPPDELFDVVVLSGVLEYAQDLGELLQRTSEYGRLTLASYASRKPNETITMREEQGWFNHLTAEEFEEELTALGFDHRFVATCLDGQAIYELSAEPARVADP